MAEGKIIVVEGACDGIGKSTQYQLLENKMISDGFDVVKHHFPTYDSYQGELAKRYLAGDFGETKHLSKYFIHSLYAVDRAITWHKDLKKEYEEGKVVLLDRYTTSSLIYQAALIEDLEEKKDFIDYVCDFEYVKLGVKKPDVVIFLCAPFDLVTKMRSERKQNEGLENDLHERNLEFMRNVYDNAVFVADYLGWIKIECSENGKMKTIEQIHNDIIEKLKL